MKFVSFAGPWTKRRQSGLKGLNGWFSVPVLMVHVRDMRMPVPYSRMSMGMRVGLARWVARQVLMLVVVIVLHGLMVVLVLVVLGQV